MFRFIRPVMMLVLLCVGNAQALGKYPGIGRTATSAEVRAWDIDVRPDFTGLPPGSGSVVKGQEVWEGKCASCHGTFGESNEVFSPLVGGTTAEDMRVGRVKALQEAVPRTTMMKVSSISTLWDYINRAMPWNAPKSLSTDEVYASLAYLLNLADIVPADFILSDKTIRDVQARLPNRHGKVKYENLWDIRSKGDVQNVACMRNCTIETGLSSTLPDFAQGTHGNLAEQQRNVGPARGVNTAKRVQAKTDSAAVSLTKSVGEAMLNLSREGNCTACHQIDKKFIGPGFQQIATKYIADSGAESNLIEKVKTGGSGVWGTIPMPPSALHDEDIRALVKWILSGAPEK